MNLLQAVADPNIFRPHFADATAWRAWWTVLRALFGLPIPEADLRLYRKLTGRREPPTAAFSEGYFVVGRRGGKSRIAALVAVFLACFVDHRRHLAPGERGRVLVLAADRRQARIVFGYAEALITETPLLADLVEPLGGAGEINLKNGVSIEVVTASFRAVRGYTVVAAICDEVAYWRSEDAANPDFEIVNAVRPAMATIPGAMLLGISSPYRRAGVLYEARRNHFGEDDSDVLVVQADSRTMNPTLPQTLIDKAYDRDPASAAAEYGAKFRTDIEGFVSAEAIKACVAVERRELPPVSGVQYVGFVDPSGGSRDSMTLAIAHREDEQAVLDCIRERKPPFSPEGVVSDFADTLKAYGLHTVTGDRYAGEWPRERFRRAGIEYRTSERTKSAIYGAFLPIVNSGRVELLDEKRLKVQLAGLERRTSRAGQDSIDHPPGGFDDVVNAAAGALVLTAEPVAEIRRLRVVA